MKFTPSVRNLHSNEIALHSRRINIDASINDNSNSSNNNNNNDPFVTNFNDKSDKINIKKIRNKTDNKSSNINLMQSKTSAVMLEKLQEYFRITQTANTVGTAPKATGKLCTTSSALPLQSSSALALLSSSSPSTSFLTEPLMLSNLPCGNKPKSLPISSTTTLSITATSPVSDLKSSGSANATVSLLKTHQHRHYQQADQRQTRSLPGISSISSRDDRNSRKIHRCDVIGCNKVYTKSSHLKAHKRTHTGKRVLHISDSNVAISERNSY